MGVTKAVQDKLEDAEKYLAAALSAAIKGFGTDHPYTAGARQNLVCNTGWGTRMSWQSFFMRRWALLHPPVLLRRELCQ